MYYRSILNHAVSFFKIFFKLCRLFHRAFSPSYFTFNTNLLKHTYNCHERQHAKLVIISPNNPPLFENSERYNYYYLCLWFGSSMVAVNSDHRRMTLTDICFLCWSRHGGAFNLVLISNITQNSPTRNRIRGSSFFMLLLLLLLYAPFLRDGCSRRVFRSCYR